MLTKRMFKMTAMAAAMTAVLCSAFISSANAAEMRDSQDSKRNGHRLESW